ncbi:hypothetical protein FBU30_005575 [Linnemannia zychae]|nr:hypothetical protein FBU30_005575 [Linnemannia zychae]
MIITVAIALATIKGIFTTAPPTPLHSVADSTTTTVTSSSSTNGSTTATTTTATTKTTLSSSTTAGSIDTTTTTPALESDQKQDKKEKKEKKEKKNKEGQPPIYEDDANIPYVSAQDCNTCPTPCQDEDHTHYPSYLKIDHELPLLHSMKPYTRHVLISTGKDDWDAHIDTDPSQLAHHLQKAIDAGQQRLRDENGGKDVPRIVLTNSSRHAETWDGPGWQVIILPDQIIVNNVTPEQCEDFFDAFLRPPVGTVFEGPVTTTPIVHRELQVEKDGQDSVTIGTPKVSSARSTSTEQSTDGSTRTITTTTTITTTSATSSKSTHALSTSSSASSIHSTASSGFEHATTDTARKVHSGSTTFVAHRWLPKAAIMICSHGKRDNRCSKTAPLLKKQFLQILRQKDIYGDAEGDVEIWLVSHIGGHKFAGNVIVHHSEPEEKTSMAIWYGRVEPCHAQAIVEASIERGEVIRELYRGSMLGSFDPSKKKIAW